MIRWRGSIGASRAFADPVGDHRGLLVDQSLQRPGEKIADRPARRAGSRWRRAARPRAACATSRAWRRCSADLLDRIAGRVEIAERLQPFLQRILQHRQIDRLLGGEIVEEVRLRQSGSLGDTVDGRAAKAVGGENLQRRLQDRRAVLLLDAGRLFRRRLGFVHPRLRLVFALTGGRT